MATESEEFPDFSDLGESETDDPGPLRVPTQPSDPERTPYQLISDFVDQEMDLGDKTMAEMDYKQHDQAAKTIFEYLDSEGIVSAMVRDEGSALTLSQLARELLGKDWRKDKSKVTEQFAENMDGYEKLILDDNSPRTSKVIYLTRIINAFPLVRDAISKSQASRRVTSSSEEHSDQQLRGWMDAVNQPDRLDDPESDHSSIRGAQREHGSSLVKEEVAHLNARVNYDAESADSESRDDDLEHDMDYIATAMQDKRKVSDGDLDRYIRGLAESYAEGNPRYTDELERLLDILGSEVVSRGMAVPGLPHEAHKFMYKASYRSGVGAVDLTGTSSDSAPFLSPGRQRTEAEVQAELRARQQMRHTIKQEQQTVDTHTSTVPSMMQFRPPISMPSLEAGTPRRSLQATVLTNQAQRYGGPAPFPGFSAPSVPAHPAAPSTPNVMQQQPVTLHTPHNTGANPASAVSTPATVIHHHHRPVLMMPSPAAARYGPRATIPIAPRRRDRRARYSTRPSLRDRHRAYKALHLSERPLATHKPDKSEPIGKYALLETSGSRFHLEVKQGASRDAVRRIAHLVFVHAKSRPDAKLNVMQGGKERTLGRLKDLSLRKLQAIVTKAAAEGGGTFVIVQEKKGGALSSAFWRHPAVARLLSRRN